MASRLLAAAANIKSCRDCRSMNSAARAWAPRTRNCSRSATASKSSWVELRFKRCALIRSKWARTKRFLPPRQEPGDKDGAATSRTAHESPRLSRKRFLMIACHGQAARPSKAHVLETHRLRRGPCAPLGKRALKRLRFVERQV